MNLLQEYDTNFYEMYGKIVYDKQGNETNESPPREEYPTELPDLPFHPNPKIPELDSSFQTDTGRWKMAKCIRAFYKCNDSYVPRAQVKQLLPTATKPSSANTKPLELVKPETIVKYLANPDETMASRIVNRAYDNVPPVDEPTDEAIKSIRFGLEVRHCAVKGFNVPLIRVEIYKTYGLEIDPTPYLPSSRMKPLENSIRKLKYPSHRSGI